jgi:flagellum-specific peptidoglycan hydrolase FlgJ
MPTRDSGVLTRADFRVYSTMLEGFEGYVNFLKNSKRYESAFSETSGLRFVQRVLAAGYCPDSDYLGNVEKIMDRHRLLELDQFLQEGKEAHDIAWKPESNRTEFRKFLAKDRS